MKQQMEERKSMVVVFPPEATEERLLTSRRGDVNTWFVGTVNRFPREAHFSFIWSMQEFESESAARRYAKDALNKGLRVEAGTLPEIRPEIRVRWREAGAWVASSEAV